MNLALASCGSTLQWINIPELDIVGQIFYADGSMHFPARLAEPHDAELRLLALILQIENIARLELRADALQGCAAAADGAQAGGLGEGAGVGVHAPDFYGKLDGNSLLAAAIHSVVALRNLRAWRLVTHR
jgi:hypothetical protein